MATKMLMVSASAILLLGIISETSAQWRRGGYGYGHHSQPYYQQQGPAYGGYEQNQYQQLPPGVSVQEAEWVCKNPKTGDMMIIASEDVPSTNGQQQPNYPQPTSPPATPSYPTYNPSNPFLSNIQPTQNPQQPTAGVPTNGEGAIDIRLGE